ncbi:MAG: hypothetical protein OEZ22_04595 [Spirochaetia bacterium]|nr:hypothetical protein [Spirochaetia bacterium]
MLYFSYNIFLIFLYPFLVFLSIFIKRLKYNFQIRREKIEFKNNQNKIVYWFHASSVGEYESIRPLAHAIKQKKSQSLIVFSVFSDSAYTQRKNDILHDFFFVLPIDFSWKMKKLIKQINPKIIFYSRYDVWPNMVKIAASMNITQYLISAVLPAKSARGKGLTGQLYANIYKYLNNIFSVHKEHTKRFKNLSLNAKTAGDIRFDSIKMKLKNPPSNFINEGKKIKLLFNHKKAILIGGSTYSKSEDFLIETIKNNIDMGLILVPHHINKNHITKIIHTTTKNNLNFILYSNLKNRKVNDNIDILIVDKLGLLQYLYSLANFAYVGGGWKGSVHSVIESSYFGLPLITGPYINNSQEAIDLKKRGCLYVMKSPSYKEISSFYNYSVKNKNKYIKIKDNIKKYFNSNLNSVDYIIKNISLG